MNSVMEFMGKDHDRLDKIFEEFRNQDSNIEKSKKFFHNFKIGLQRHIVWEEEILFPLFEDKMGLRDAGPTVVMRAEHRQIKEFLEKIHCHILQGELDGIKKPSNELLETLKAHNDKEENILYPWIDEEISLKCKEDAFFKMQNLSPEKYEKCCGE